MAQHADSHADHPLALAQGFVVEGLRIERVLGQGNFGITYLVHDTLLDQPFALKEYMPREAALRSADGQIFPNSAGARDSFQSGLARFIAEGRTVAPLEHANIVRVIRCFEANGTAYLLMPYYHGEPLNVLLERGGTFGPDEVKALLWPLLDALEYLHARNVTHRDIKPANIYVTVEGRPILIDFGAARVAARDGTESHTAIGSEGYAAREQSSTRGRIGPWTDIYGLSATLYRLITGTIPASANDRGEELFYGRPDPLPRLSEVASESHHDPGFLVAIEYGLQVRVEDRPQSVAQWREVIRRPTLFSAQASPRSVTGQVPTMPPAERPDRMPLVLGVVLLLLVIIGGTLLWMPSQPDQAAPEMASSQAPTPEAAGEAPAEMPAVAASASGEREREDAAWALAEAANTASAYGQYLQEFPQGSYAEDAQARRDLLQGSVSGSSMAAPSPARAERPAAPETAEVAETPATVAPVAAPAPPRPGDALRDCAECPRLVVVPAGAFWQGATEGDRMAGASEKPRRRVSIREPFAIAATEVTFEQWDACVADGGCRARPADNWGRGAMPVVNVSWNDAQEYVDWLTRRTGRAYRLPSESEWEYVARAGDEGMFAGGSEAAVCQGANVAGAETDFAWRHTACSDAIALGTAPAGNLPANRLGLHDLVGNVAEWVQDCVNLSYVDAPTDGSAWERGMCGTRLARGGSWFAGTRDLRLSARLTLKVGERNDFTGFRVVRALQ